MTALKCKMCGGDIQITGEAHGICQSCGCEVTLPKIDDDKRTEFYNRGNYFRQRGDFDRAYSAFEHIIADDMRDAEAHWSLTLCRYGVEYVQDPRSGEYLPTVSRMSYSPVLEDPDYLKALEYSDTYTQGLYRTEAQKIANIQEEYIQISRREKPYDVFICFKAEEDNGQRTQGSIVAQDIYEELTQSGVRTFFSRVTLRNIAGEKYEPYIFAALNSALIMLVVTSNPDHTQARWVKNEWTRFLNMKDKDAAKLLIPVCKNVSPYDLPQELQNCGQSVDASVLGYKVDLKKRILERLGRSQSTAVPGKTVDVRSTTVKNLLIRVRQAVEDKDFDQAGNLLEQVQSLEPENGEAFYYRLLIKNQCQNLKELVNKNLEWEQDPLVKRILQQGTAEHKKDVQGWIDATHCHKKYLAGVDAYKKKNYGEAQGLFKDIQHYKKAKEYFKECKKILYHEEKLREYKALVGDGKEYLKETFRRQHYEQYCEHLRLHTQWDRKMDSAILLWVYLILGALLALFGFFHMQQLLEAGSVMGHTGGLISATVFKAKTAGYKLNLLWPILYLLVTVCLAFAVTGEFAGTSQTENLFFVFLPGVLTAGVGLMALLASLFAIPQLPALYPVASVPFLILSLIAGIRSRGKDAARTAYLDHWYTKVRPFEIQERERIQKIYGNILTKEDLVELKDVIHITEDSDKAGSE